MIPPKLQPNISYFTLTDPPRANTDFGAEGYIAYDDEYLYVYSDRRWKRTALSQVPSGSLPRMISSESAEGFVTHDASYFYLYMRNAWTSFAVSIVNTLKRITQPYGAYNHITKFRLVPAPRTKNTFGQDGYLAYDKEYFYIYIQKEWHRIAIGDFSVATGRHVLPKCL